jgi:hypothetical protein
MYESFTNPFSGNLSSATLSDMAKQTTSDKDRKPKNQPLSLRLDEDLANALEDIRQAMGKVATVRVSTTALVEKAIEEFVASRAYLLKGKPKPK